jgi:hypothetical protein
VAIHEKWHPDPRAVWRDRRPRAAVPEHIGAPIVVFMRLKERSNDPMADDVDGPYVLGPGGARPIDLGTFKMILKAEAGDTGGAFTLLEACEPPNADRPFTFITTPRRRSMCSRANTSSSWKTANTLARPARSSSSPHMEVIGPVREGYL